MDWLRAGVVSIYLPRAIIKRFQRHEISVKKILNHNRNLPK